MSSYLNLLQMVRSDTSSISAILTALNPQSAKNRSCSLVMAHVGLPINPTEGRGAE